MIAVKSKIKHCNRKKESKIVKIVKDKSAHDIERIDFNALQEMIEPCITQKTNNEKKEVDNTRETNNLQTVMLSECMKVDNENNEVS